MEKDEELKFQTEVLTRLAVIENKLDGYKETEKTVYKVDTRSKQNEEDIKEIKDKIKWLSHTITGTIITGIGGIVFLLIQLGMGVS